MQLEEKTDRIPRQLSGGEQQRVALARAIIAEPSVLLLDEPLSNLDAKLRAGMQIELIELHRKLGLTTIFVTHDQEEALALSDVIVLMLEGRVKQIGTPEEIYSKSALTLRMTLPVFLRPTLENFAFLNSIVPSHSP